MSFKEFVSKEMVKKSICIILLLIVAVLSMTVISKVATSPESYKSTIQSIIKELNQLLNKIEIEQIEIEKETE